MKVVLKGRQFTTHPKLNTRQDVNGTKGKLIITVLAKLSSSLVKV